MLNDWSQLQERAARWPQLTEPEREAALELARAASFSAAELPQLLALADALGADQQAPLDPLAVALLDTLLARCASTLHPSRLAESGLSDATLREAAELYRRLGSTSRGRYVLLQLLAADGRPAALAAFAEAMAADPPGEPQQIGIAFLPLFQQADLPAAALFPRLLDALSRPETATLALELANFAVRQGLLADHPAQARGPQLAGLLGGVAQRLLQLEEHPEKFAGTPAEARQAVTDWIALATTLCQALGLIGDASLTGKLEQALEVRHRRLRTEAAAALAQLGEKRGFEVLVESAREPATRQRALACLEALGELERVAEEHRTPGARAAAELADWLARPAQFGLPPAHIDVIDHCRQYWPGYAEPVDCYLVGFDYQLPQGEYSNVGIVGPVTSAITPDLEDLVPADIYALFAGWQAEHAEIHEQAAASLTDSARQAAQRRLAELAGQGFSQLELAKVGMFFGEVLLVATALRHGLGGTVIVDGPRVEWYPHGEGRRPLGSEEAYWMHKGRKLLAAFNRPPEPAE
ncbi:MAG: HEAT repeat domain-containing protein [Planctomycetaceae bacterium]|nr:HEAT repeat domain-containing protein [Planctomycetaceae bacterium]